MRYILGLFLIVFCHSVFAVPPYVERSIKDLRAIDEKIKRKAAFSLSSYFTDNGPGSSDPKIIDENIDLFYLALKDPITARSITDIFGARHINLGNGNYYLYLDKARPETKKKVLPIILENLNSTDKGLAKNSADALINVWHCQYEKVIRTRANNGRQAGESEFAFKYVLKTLDKRCASKP